MRKYLEDECRRNKGWQRDVCSMPSGHSVSSTMDSHRLKTSTNWLCRCVSRASSPNQHSCSDWATRHCLSATWWNSRAMTKGQRGLWRGKNMSKTNSTCSERQMRDTAKYRCCSFLSGIPTIFRKLSKICCVLSVTSIWIPTEPSTLFSKDSSRILPLGNISKCWVCSRDPR